MFTNGGGVKAFGLRSWIYVHCTINLHISPQVLVCELQTMAKELLHRKSLLPSSYCPGNRHPCDWSDENEKSGHHASST